MSVGLVLVMVLYFFCTITFSLLRRKLSLIAPEYNTVIQMLLYLVVQLPIGVTIALIWGFDPDIGWPIALLLFLGSALWPWVERATYWLNQRLDAGQVALLFNLSPVLTMGIAAALLGDVLSTQQYLGAILIVISTAILTLGTQETAKFALAGVAVAFPIIFVESAADVYEAWVIDEITLASYFIYGLASQAFWAIVMAIPSRHLVKTVLSSPERRNIFIYIFTRGLRGFSFLFALWISGSVSLVSALTAASPLAVIVAAYYLISETDHAKTKFIAGVIATAGLVAVGLG